MRPAHARPGQRIRVPANGVTVGTVPGRIPEATGHSARLVRSDPYGSPWGMDRALGLDGGPSGPSLPSRTQHLLEEERWHLHECVDHLVPETGWPRPAARPHIDLEADHRLLCLMRGQGAPVATREWRKTPEGIVHEDYTVTYEDTRYRHDRESCATHQPPHRGPAWAAAETVPLVHRGHNRQCTLTLHDDRRDQYLRMNWTEGDGYWDKRWNKELQERDPK